MLCKQYSTSGQLFDLWRIHAKDPQSKANKYFWNERLKVIIEVIKKQGHPLFIKIYSQIIMH